MTVTVAPTGAVHASFDAPDRALLAIGQPGFERGFVNNSLDAMLQAGKTIGLASRCAARLEHEYNGIERYRTRESRSFRRLSAMSTCPTGAGASPALSQQLAVVVFGFMIHSSTLLPLDAAASLGAAASDRFAPRFVFQVDRSSPAELQEEVALWAAQSGGRAAAVEPQVDVEYASISSVDGWLAAMRLALERWPDLSLFVPLSESHALVKPGPVAASLFSSIALSGLSFGIKPPTRAFGDGNPSSSDTFYSLALNDVIFACGGKLLHVGWRREALYPDPAITSGELWALWSGAFVRWLVSGPLPPAAVALHDLLRYFPVPDEFFFHTLHRLSPHCHAVNYTLERDNINSYFWTPECWTGSKLALRVQPDYCPRLMAEPLEWYAIQRPIWLDERDAAAVSRLSAPFARKVHPDEARAFLAIFNSNRSSAAPWTAPGRFQLRARTYNRCLHLVRQGSGWAWQWKACSREEARGGERLDEFILRDCIGELVLAAPPTAAAAVGELSSRRWPSGALWGTA
mmetsp:Transcript_47454/g.154024  ORF Transcript_47454/g.154024 Transcript_47454/m.154024 type:complete len:517 (-) Transcript_47454:601-2151(-)